MNNHETEQKKFISLIKSLSGSHSSHEIFSDFCAMAAISLYQPFARDEALEKEYMSIVNKYRKKDAGVFSELLGCVIEGLTASFGDFLGVCYMALEISNKHQGQFFTPYTISKFMVAMLDIPEKEKICLSEPACGAGGMIIAYAEMMKKQKINYQRKLEVQAVDIDKMCFHMTYIQLSLLNISAEVIWGNSLTLETYQIWHTPSNLFYGGYRWGLKHTNTIKPKDATEEDVVCAADIPMKKNIFIQPSLF